MHNIQSKFVVGQENNTVWGRVCEFLSFSLEILPAWAVNGVNKVTSIVFLNMVMLYKNARLTMV